MLNLCDIHSENLLFDSRYRLVKKIGGGGFSEVWLALDTRSGVNVVLKIYSSATDLNEDGIGMFRKEFSIVCNLNHTNILKPFTFDILQGCPYIVMPYCDRGSAVNLIGKMTEDEAWNFIIQVASGLAHLHAHQIIHQDIKPANVLINHDNQYMITDFGISTGLRNTIRKSVANAEEAGTGTTAYMSYECLCPKPTNAIARDIWALGASVFELITGDVPFGEFGGITQKSEKGKIPKIEVPISDCLRQLIKKCLAFNPWDRPSAEEIIQMAQAREQGSGNSPIKVIGKYKYFISGIAISLAALIVITDPFGLKSTDYEQDIVVITNPNDSILLAKIHEANNIVDLEKDKQDNDRIESNLCMAAEIYRQAMSLEVSDSVSTQGKALWAQSQEVIDKTFNWFESRRQYYHSLNATDASSHFKKRGEMLRPYISGN